MNTVSPQARRATGSIRKVVSPCPIRADQAADPRLGRSRGDPTPCHNCKTRMITVSTGHDGKPSTRIPKDGVHRLSPRGTCRAHALLPCLRLRPYQSNPIRDHLPEPDSVGNYQMFIQQHLRTTHLIILSQRKSLVGEFHS